MSRSAGHAWSGYLATSSRRTFGRWGRGAGATGSRMSGADQSPMTVEQAKVISKAAVVGPASGFAISGALMPSPVTV